MASLPFIALGCIDELIARLRPKVYICGHIHNPDRDCSSNKLAKLDGGVGAHVACTGLWNQFFGVPYAIDVSLDCLTA